MAETAGRTVRYRCDGCGNLTRFDVTVVRRTKEFRHFTVGGDLEVESVEVLDEDVQSVSCRWCGATDERIEVLTG
jgi:YD repeat-containing protein